MHRLKIVLIGALVPLLFTSCSSAQFVQVDFDTAYNNGNYDLCIKMLKHKDYGGNRSALKNIDIGVLSHYKKDYTASTRYFNEGDRLLEEGNTDDVAQFESFYLNILNALNYYHQNKLEDAVVELKKADDIKIRAGRENKKALWHVVDTSGNVDIVRGFDEDAEDNEQKAKLEAAYDTFGIKPADLDIGLPRKPTENDLYHGSATAYYLGAVIRSAHGDSEGARLDKDYVTALNPELARTHLLSKVLKPQRDKAVLHIISFSGAIASKKEVSFYFPPEHNGEAVFIPGIIIPIEGARLSLPPIRFKFAYSTVGENATTIDRIEAVITNTAIGTSDAHPFFLLEDFGEEVKKNNALKARKEYQQNVATSIIGKLTAAISSGAAIFAARRAVELAGNVLMKAVAEVSLAIAEAALPLALDKSNDAIRADVRQARFLPAKSSVAAFTLQPGTYSVHVRYLNGSTLLFEEGFDHVELKNKECKLLESLCLK